MGQIERENLVNAQSQLAYKVANSTNVVDNIRTPGWINKENPRAFGLRLTDLDTDFKAGKYSNKFENMVRVGRIVKRLTDQLPQNQQRLDLLNTQIKELAEKELLQREQIFTQEQAAIIAHTLHDMIGVTFLSPNDSEVFTFQVDDSDKAQVEPVIDELTTVPVQPSRLWFKERTLDELDMLLSNQELLNKAFEEQRVSPNMQIFLTWLFEQNDKYGGQLCNLLSLSTEYKPDQYRPYYGGWELDLVKKGGRVAHLSPFLSPHIKMSLAKYNAEHHPKPVKVGQPDTLQKQPAAPEAEENNTEVGDAKANDKEPSEINVAPLSPQPFIEPPQKPRIPDIERRDLQVYERIKSYLHEVENRRLSFPIISGGLNRNIGRITDVKINKAVEKGYSVPGGSKDHPTHDLEDILVLMYITDPENPTRESLSPRLIKEYRRIARDEIAKWETERRKRG